MKKEVKLLHELAESIAIPLNNTDGVKWPIRSGQVIGPVKSLYAIEYVEQLRKLIELDDFSTDMISNSMILIRQLHHIINGLIESGRDNRLIAKDLLMITRILQEKTNNAKIGGKSHHILTNLGLEELRKVNFNYQKSETHSLIKLSALLWAYSEALYFQGRDIGGEYHGLYEISNKQNALVREFYNFSPIDLWGNTKFRCKYRKIKIVTTHDTSLDLFFDAYNNISVMNGNIMDSSISGALYIDDERVDTIYIKELCDFFSNELTHQVSIVNSMNGKELLERYLEIFWYRKREFAKKLNLSWKPPKEAYEILSNINKKSIEPTKKNPYGKVTFEELIKKYDFSMYI